MSQKVRINGVKHTGASVFLGVDRCGNPCWTRNPERVQYDEPPSVLHEYERFLAYDLLSEALGQAGVLAPIRYEYL